MKAGRRVEGAITLVRLKHDGVLAKVIAVEVLEAVRFWIYIIIRTTVVLVYDSLNKRRPMIKRGYIRIITRSSTF